MISLGTALIIQANDVDVDFGGPDEKGLFCGWISLARIDRWEPLLSTNPIYKTSSDALAAMHKVVDVIKELDLSNEKEKLASLLDGRPAGIADQRGRG